MPNFHEGKGVVCPHSLVRQTCNSGALIPFELIDKNIKKQLCDSHVSITSKMIFNQSLETTMANWFYVKMLHGG